MASGGVAQDQRRDTLRVGGGEEHGHLAAFGVPEKRRPLGANGVHYAANVFHPLLQGRQRRERNGIRDARPPLIEAEESAEGREATKETGQRRLLPHDFDVAAPVRDEHEVARTAADDLVRNVAVVARRVSCLDVVHGGAVASSWPNELASSGRRGGSSRNREPCLRRPAPTPS